MVNFNCFLIAWGELGNRVSCRDERPGALACSWSAFTRIAENSRTTEQTGHSQAQANKCLERHSERLGMVEQHLPLVELAHVERQRRRGHVVLTTYPAWMGFALESQGLQVF